MDGWLLGSLSDHRSCLKMERFKKASPGPKVVWLTWYSLPILFPHYTTISYIHDCSMIRFISIQLNLYRVNSKQIPSRCFLSRKKTSKIRIHLIKCTFNFACLIKTLSSLLEKNKQTYTQIWKYIKVHKLTIYTSYIFRFNCSSHFISFFSLRYTGLVTQIYC